MVLAQRLLIGRRQDGVNGRRTARREGVIGLGKAKESKQSLCPGCLMAIINELLKDTVKEDKYYKGTLRIKPTTWPWAETAVM